MKATVKWNSGLAFTGIAKSIIPIPIDADASLGGSNSGVQPMEMIAMGLTACIGMDVLSILQKKRQAVTSLDVNFDAPRSPEHPKVFTSAVITILLAGKAIDETALLRSIELSVTKYCAAYAVLEKAFPISVCYEIYEDEWDGTRRLTCQGRWQEMMQG